MRLSEIEGEQALDVLAEILEPVSVIAQDEKLRKEWEHGNKFKVIAKLLKNYKNEVIHIMAALECKKVEDYKFNLLTLPKQLLDIVNDEEFQTFFGSQEQTDSPTLSIPVTETTQEDRNISSDI